MIVYGQDKSMTKRFCDMSNCKNELTDLVWPQLILTIGPGLGRKWDVCTSCQLVLYAIMGGGKSFDRMEEMRSNRKPTPNRQYDRHPLAKSNPEERPLTIKERALLPKQEKNV